jgi:multicomponent Na+:H+ antiporter subunit E
MITRLLALFVWAYGVWLLLTWTVTFEQLVFGGLLAAVVACALAPLGEVARPWRLLDPRILFAVLRLLVVSLGRIVRANVELARRIWTPSLPLASGLISVPTSMRTDGGVGGTGLITSLIVDNQLADLDRRRNELQFHAVTVPDGDAAAKGAAITEPTERLLAPILRRGR